MAISSRSAIGRIKAMASTHEGAGHWQIERLTSLALIPLLIWFVVSAVSLSGAGYAEVRHWLGGTFNSTMMVLLVVLSFWHAKLGVEVIIEDYVHKPASKFGSLVALKFAVVTLAVMCLVATLKVSLGSV